MDAKGAALTGSRRLDDARMRINDARVAHLLANEARDRAVARIFGVPRDQAFLVTIIALGTAAGVAHERVTKALTAPGGPTLADAAIGVVSLKEVVYRIAGTDSRETPLLGTLILIAVLEASFGPARRGTVQAIRASSHAVRTAYDHRLGLLFPARDRRQ